MNDDKTLNTQSELEQTAAAVSGVEALCNSAGQEIAHKDLALCSVCLQWTCDGPQCHRPGICED